MKRAKQTFIRKWMSQKILSQQWPITQFNKHNPKHTNVHKSKHLFTLEIILLLLWAAGLFGHNRSLALDDRCSTTNGSLYDKKKVQINSMTSTQLLNILS